MCDPEPRSVAFMIGHDDDVVLDPKIDRLRNSRRFSDGIGGLRTRRRYGVN